MKNQGKIKPFDSEASHAAIVAKGDAVVVAGHEIPIIATAEVGPGGVVTLPDGGSLCDAIAASNKPVIETNDRGGRQSKIKGRMTEVPPLALIEVSAVMGLGAENYPRDENDCPNWYNIDWKENLDHALEHAFNALGARNDPDAMDKIEYAREELSHATARMMMAMEQFIREEL